MVENDFYEEEEKRLLVKYNCENLDQVLQKQKKILENDEKIKDGGKIEDRRLNKNSSSNK